MIERMPGETRQDALQLLQIFSFFHYEGIPEEMFHQLWNVLRTGAWSSWMLSHQMDVLLC